ncbi:aminotransferase class III-fold pyridoxal phosphate-dependent enzyme [candidate division KSB1 bacterium]|nr:aminotransferase class III-fold pyridoxal phosphate-dependent enzyme [candidate division KSB1 bacterium]
MFNGQTQTVATSPLGLRPVIDAKISTLKTKPIENDPQRSQHEEVRHECRKWLDIISGVMLEERQHRRMIEETLENHVQFVNRQWGEARKSVSAAGDYACLEWMGQASKFCDNLGREYIDCLGGYGLYNAGIRHPKIVKAVAAQLQRNPLSSQELLDPLRGALSKILAHITPGDLQYSFLINNGTDAVEGAMKLARAYTGKHGFISSLGAFHGKSLGSLSLMGKLRYRKAFEPLLPDVSFVEFGDEEELEFELQKANKIGWPIAAVVLEPIQGEAGAIVPPNDYWPKVREICTQYGVLLVADEVQTGLGRTGKMFAVEHWNVKPDIMCLGKALGGGVMPLAAFVSTAKIWSVFEKDPQVHSSTTGGNPLACAAGIAAIMVTLEEDLPGQAARKGAYMLAAMRNLQERYGELISAARGKGLLLGMQFKSAEIGWQIVSRLFRKGVLVAGTMSNSETVRFEPALNIPDVLIDEILNRLEDTLREVREGRI